MCPGRYLYAHGMSPFWIVCGRMGYFFVVVTMYDCSTWDSIQHDPPSRVVETSWERLFCIGVRLVLLCSLFGCDFLQNVLLTGHEKDHSSSTFWLFYNITSSDYSVTIDLCTLHHRT